MNFNRWKLGAGIAIFCGLLTAGAGLLGDMTWKGFVAVLCTSLLTNFLNFLAKHPIESIADDEKKSAPAGTIASNLGLLAFILVPIAIGLLGALLTGCSTQGTAPTSPATNQLAQIFTPERTARVVKIAARDGVTIALHDNPDTRIFFEASVIALNTMLSDTDLDPYFVRIMLAQLAQGDANSAEWIGITAALSAYEIYFGDVVAAKLNTNEYLLPVLEALRDGVSQALASPITLPIPPPHVD